MMLVVLAAGFTSCSNDDIPLEEKVTYKTFETTFVVDPSGVVEPYRFESYPGHLTVVPSDAQLRIRILIYNLNGDLKDVLENKQSNYQSLWSAKKNLEAGTYLAFAISDVINTNNPDVTEYWNLKDYDKISSAKLIKESYWLGYEKEILGISNFQFSVGSSSSTHSVNLKPAGAACYFSIYGLKKYTNVVNYSLLTDHKVNYLFWDSSFELKPNKEVVSGEGIDGFNEMVGGVDISPDISEDRFTAFFYIFPSKKQYFNYCAFLDDGGAVLLGKQVYVDEIKAGEQYYFTIQLGSNYNNNGYSQGWNVSGLTYEEWEKWNQDSRNSISSNSIYMPMRISNNMVYLQAFKENNNSKLLKDIELFVLSK